MSSSALASEGKELPLSSCALQNWELFPSFDPKKIVTLSPFLAGKERHRGLFTLTGRQKGISALCRSARMGGGERRTHNRRARTYVSSFPDVLLALYFLVRLVFFFPLHIFNESARKIAFFIYNLRLIYNRLDGPIIKLRHEIHEIVVIGP